jgi:hypothetical protein
MSHRPTAADATSTVTSAAGRDSSAASGATASSSSPVSVAANAAGASSAEDCPSPTGARPESYSGSNNSPFATRTDPEPTHCEIARENNHKWTRLVGYTADEATRRAKAAGYAGKIEVRPLSEYDAKCKEGMVCRFDPARWEIEGSGTLTLYTNHKVQISTPD